MIKCKQTDEQFLTLENSYVLYGIAIVMMLFHHLFLNMGGLDFKIVVISTEFIEKTAWFCKICVSVYAFVSG